MLPFTLAADPPTRGQGPQPRRLVVECREGPILNPSEAEAGVYVGIDAGGTRTTCAIVDRSGRLLGNGEGPGANFTNEEAESVVSSMGAALSQALRTARVDRRRLRRACICMAGYAPEKDEERAHKLIAPVFAPAATRYARDLDSALAAVCGGGEGLVIIAGTGSVAFGRDKSGSTHRVGGWGYLVGDEGSGFFIGREAIRLTLRSLDGREPASLLSVMVQERTGESDPVAIDKRIYRERWRAADFAAFAPCVFDAAAQGDPMAVSILEQASHDLAEMAAVVVDALSLVDAPCGLSGGVWKAEGLLLRRFTERMSQMAPSIRVVLPTLTPAEGAAHLAIEGDGEASPS